MTQLEFDVIEKLDGNDKQKIEYFIKLLLKQSKYRKLRDQIKRRKREINKGEILTHDELWKSLNV